MAGREKQAPREGLFSGSGIYTFPLVLPRKRPSSPQLNGKAVFLCHPLAIPTLKANELSTKANEREQNNG